MLLLNLNSFLNNYKFMTNFVSFIQSKNFSELSEHGHPVDTRYVCMSACVLTQLILGLLERKMT